jgi:hypothetical protein
MSAEFPDTVGGNGEIFLVNVVHVNDGMQEQALEVLRRTVDYVARTYQSFRWSRLYRSLDGKVVINQALWTSREEFESIFNDSHFLERYNGLRETGTWEFHVYEVSDIILPRLSVAS